MVIFYKKWKKYNKIKMTKNKMDLNIRKMTNHPPYPVSMAIENGELMHECFLKHARMGTARMK